MCRQGSFGKSYNLHSIGICYVGGLDQNGNPRHKNGKHKKALIELVKKMRATYNIKDILGHRDASPDLNGDGKITKERMDKILPVLWGQGRVRTCNMHGRT